MTDRGFTIHDDLARVGVSLNIPWFLSGRDYLTKAEVKASQIITSVHLHIERAIQRIETYSIIRNEIWLTLHRSFSHIWRVICLVNNLAPPLIVKAISNKALLPSHYSPVLQNMHYFFLIDSSERYSERVGLQL